MKTDYSTFVQLPQKTSLCIDSQVNMSKAITQKKCVIKNSIRPINSTGKPTGADLVKLKRRMFCNQHFIFKQG